MKIIKKPKFKKITCHVCGCVYLPQDKDVLTKDGSPVVSDRIFVECPVCRNLSYAEPVKKPPQPHVETAPVNYTLDVEVQK